MIIRYRSGKYLEILHTRTRYIHARERLRGAGARAGRAAARAQRCLKHSSLPRGLFGSQCESSFGLSTLDDARRDVFAQGRAVFESVAGAASYQPDVVEIGMAVDKEIAVRRVFVLANPRLDERRVRQPRKAPGQKRARQLKRIFSQVALGGVRVNRLAVTIEPEFEAAIFQVGHAVSFGAEIDPGRRQRRGEARVARRDTEKIHLLASRANSISEQRGK